MAEDRLILESAIFISLALSSQYFDEIAVTSEVFSDSDILALESPINIESGITSEITVEEV